MLKDKFPHDNSGSNPDRYTILEGKYGIIHYSQFQKFVDDGLSYKEIGNKLGCGTTKAGYWLKKFNLKTKHNKTQKKFDIIKKICPVCECEFETLLGHKKEKIVCSRSCSNTYFRSNENNGNFKGGSSSYRSVCLRNHPKRCLICGFDKFIEVHHIDKNRKNGSKENLVPLCPNHHRLIHSKKYEEETIKELNNIIKQGVG